MNREIEAANLDVQITVELESLSWPHAQGSMDQAEGSVALKENSTHESGQ